MKRLLGWLFALGTLFGLLIAIYGRYVEPFRPRVRHYTLQLQRQHAHLDGLSVAFVSDTHIGPHFKAKDLAPAVAAVQRAQPDIVLLGGDYISESPRFIDEIVAPLTAIASSGRLGAYAILGNHDISNVRRKVEAAIAKTGARLLVNESVPVAYGGGTLSIVGIDDALLGRTDIVAAFAEVPADAPVIAMWHEPDLAERVAPYAPMVLLSGHTHGGQIRIPGIGEIATPKLGKRYPDGRYEIGDMPLIVSRGVGIYRPPMRVNCPPEVLILHFVA